jgi:hypothetical protein
MIGLRSSVLRVALDYIHPKKTIWHALEGDIYGVFPPHPPEQ